jgi:hypothetical protein
MEGGQDVCVQSGVRWLGHPKCSGIASFIPSPLLQWFFKLQYGPFSPRAANVAQHQSLGAGRKDDCAAVLQRLLEPQPWKQNQ